MLWNFDIKKDLEVRITDDTSKYAGRVGKITFFEEKKGFRNTYPYLLITVSFDDAEQTFNTWQMVNTQETIEEKDEPKVKERKKKQTAKRFNLTNTLVDDNLTTVHWGQIHNKLKEITMQNATVETTDSQAVTASSDATTAVTAVVTAPKRRGRKVDPNSKVSRAAVLLSALSADQLNREYAIPYLMKELDLKKEVAQVYFYSRKPKKVATAVDTAVDTASE